LNERGAIVRIGLTFNIRSEREGGTDALRISPIASDYDCLGDEDEEFDSPQTVQALAKVLDDLGHEVELLGDGEPMLRRLLDFPAPDLVFNFAEGTGAGRAREARVPAVLEMLGIPYTGSDPLTLAIALDKDCAKRIVAASSVATPKWVVYKGDFGEIAAELERLTLPLIVKPALEGSSKGILASNVIQTRDGLEDRLSALQQHYCQPVLIEEFIVGDELTVGMIGNDPPEILGVMRVVPRTSAETFVYSLEVKRDFERQVTYECPAKLSDADMTAVQRAALAAWAALGCHDVARIDFRLRAGVPYFLEANPLPGLSPHSGDLVLMAKEIGIGHGELVERIVQAAVDRHNLSARVQRPMLSSLS
jgi:D-alanine-D-alanine ligase